MPTVSSCPACGGGLGPLHTVPSSEPGWPDGGLALRRCRSCGTAITVGERPMAAHESGAYRPGRPRLHRMATPALGAFDRRRLELIASVAPPPGRLLDAGAGRGRFVLAAAAAGYEAAGLEPSATLGLDAARTGSPVTAASIETAQVSSASLDVVSLWHVLEHLEDPNGALERISKWLRPGGLLLIGVPNLASLQARVGGGRWFHLDVPRHRTHFTPAGLRALLSRHGFSSGRTVHTLAEHNPYGMWQSLVNRVTTEPSYLYNLLKRNTPWRPGDAIISAAALPLLVPAAISEAIAGLTGHGGTIAVLATRQAEG